MTNDREKYFKKIFGDDFDLKTHEATKNSDNRDRVKNALDKAWEIRNFEIELYWKRATYFWAFIATIFIGFFAVLGSQHLSSKLNIISLNINTILLLISSFGVIFSLAWVFVNEASKFWQENWEQHIFNLELEYYGKIYEELSYRESDTSHYSASKINIVVSFFVLTIWLLIFIYCFIYGLTSASLKIICSISFVTIFDLIIFVITGIFVVLFFTYAKSKKNNSVF
jgi:hypothetical protein